MVCPPAGRKCLALGTRITGIYGEVIGDKTPPFHFRRKRERSLKTAGGTTE